MRLPRLATFALSSLEEADPRATAVHTPSNSILHFGHRPLPNATDEHWGLPHAPCSARVRDARSISSASSFRGTSPSIASPGLSQYLVVAVQSSSGHLQCGHIGGPGRGTAKRAPTGSLFERPGWPGCPPRFRPSFFSPSIPFPYPRLHTALKRRRIMLAIDSWPDGVLGPLATVLSLSRRAFFLSRRAIFSACGPSPSPPYPCPFRRRSYPLPFRCRRRGAASPARPCPRPRRLQI